MSGPREIHAPTGTPLTCKNWQIEAAYRMIQNNLDPAVAEDPDHLVVSGKQLADGGTYGAGGTHNHNFHLGHS